VLRWAIVVVAIVVTLCVCGYLGVNAWIGHGLDEDRSHDTGSPAKGRLSSGPAVKHLDGLLYPDVSAGHRCTTAVGPAQPPYRIPPPSEASVISREAMSATPCQTVTLGTTATVAGPSGDGRSEVTASRAMGAEVRTAAPPVPDGRDRVWFRLHVRDVSVTGLQLPFIWVFAATPESGWMLPVDLPEPTVRLQPGDEADQIVAFDVETNARPARLRLGLEPSIVDWVLG
jgi:hypothetical protein